MVGSGFAGSGERQHGQYGHRRRAPAATAAEVIFGEGVGGMGGSITARGGGHSGGGQSGMGMPGAAGRAVVGRGVFPLGHEMNGGVLDDVTGAAGGVIAELIASPRGQHWAAASDSGPRPQTRDMKDHAAAVLKAHNSAQRANNLHGPSKVTHAHAHTHVTLPSQPYRGGLPVQAQSSPAWQQEPSQQPGTSLRPDQSKQPQQPATTPR